MPTVLAQKLIARSVLFRSIIVAISVEFDDEFRLNAREIGDETVDRMLATKFEALLAAVAQDFPQNAFVNCLGLAEFAGADGAFAAKLGLVLWHFF
jgi:hypothetical protein